jgi:hypothetical protein
MDVLLFAMLRARVCLMGRRRGRKKAKEFIDLIGDNFLGSTGMADRAGKKAACFTKRTSWLVFNEIDENCETNPGGPPSRRA